MNPKIYTASVKSERTDGKLRTRELFRLMALVWPFRRTLAIGLAATVAFAALHTLSIGGAFPVFKILLEQEGLGGWVDRAIAGDRLGVVFAQPVDLKDPTVRVASVSRDSTSKLQKFDIVRDSNDLDTRDFLRRIANASPGDTIDVQVRRPTDENPQASLTISLAPGEPSRKMQLLQTLASYVSTDTPDEKIRALSYILGGLIVLIIIANVFRYIGEVLIARSVLRAMMGLRAKLYETTLRLPMAYFADKPTSDLVTRFVQDVQEIQRGLVTLFGKFIREPLRATFILGLAFTLDWRITLTMVFVVPPTIALFWSVGRSVKKANRKLLMAYGSMIGALTTSLQNLRVVKAYTAEDQERERLRKVDRQMYRQQYRLVKLQAFVSPAIETLAVVGGSFMTVWLASRVLHDELSLSKFVTLGFTLSILFDPLRKLSDVYVRIQRSTAGAERIFAVLDAKTEECQDDTLIELGPLTKGIEFEGVTFTYPGATIPALRDVTLSIAAGEAVAIVGPNGSGKTTLVSMLPRFYDPDVGVIRFDGVDLRKAKLRSLRDQLGLVSQEAIVFAGTPVENIGYGHENPDRKDVESASVRASADEFIREIPDGYDAKLGERGSTLSGGQRQRLAIARAVYRNAPVLIFDEATSQIDTESELKIQNAIKEFAQGRTTIIIAHRLSTIQFADRIVVMQRGSIIDQGKHAELFGRCKLYRTLCETQFINAADGEIS